MRSLALVTMCLLLFVGGCSGSKKPKYTPEELSAIPLPQTNGLPEASGGFVLSVGPKTVSSADVIDSMVEQEGIVIPLKEYLLPKAQGIAFEDFKLQAQPQIQRILSMKLSDILLQEQAKKNVSEQSEQALQNAAAQEVRRFLSGFNGDYTEAEKVLKQMGMDWDSFKEHQKNAILTQSYLASKLPKPRPITHNELVERYNQLKEEFFALEGTVEFRLIDIRPAELETPDPNKTNLEQARELAAELVERLSAGEDFAKMAWDYSQGHRAAEGGLWQPVHPENLRQPYDVLAAMAEKVETGEIAGPKEVDGHIFIMKLEGKRGKTFMPLEEMQEKVEARIAAERRREAIMKLEAELVQQIPARQRRQFVDFCVRRIYELSNQTVPVAGTP